MKVYYIGGSPCSGKSTLAEMIATKYGFYYYKLDDKIEEHMKKAAEALKPRCKAYSGMTPEQVWMRTPEIQFKDEIGIYQEIFDYALFDLEKLNSSTPVITEGAGFMPELMKKVGIRINEYICIVPTCDFQIEKYSKRERVPYVLEGCSDKEKAFDNWMKRDIMFAKYAAENAEKYGYEVMWTDGRNSPSVMLGMAEKSLAFDYVDHNREVTKS